MEELLREERRWEDPMEEEFLHTNQSYCKNIFSHTVTVKISHHALFQAQNFMRTYPTIERKQGLSTFLAA